MTVPIVIETGGRTERAYDIYSRLLRDRIIFITGGIQDEMADAVVAQLLFLETEDAEKPINLYINTPGGSVSAGLAIYDVMQHVAPPVKTVCIGMAASMGSILLVGGEKGQRFIMPNGRVLIHQPLIGGVMRGPATDLEIEAQEIERLGKVLFGILADGSQHPIETVKEDCDRNKWLSAQEAVEYGIVDAILDPKKS